MNAVMFKHTLLYSREPPFEHSRERRSTVNLDRFKEADAMHHSESTFSGAIINHNPSRHYKDLKMLLVAKCAYFYLKNLRPYILKSLNLIKLEREIALNTGFIKSIANKVKVAFERFIGKLIGETTLLDEFSIFLKSNHKTLRARLPAEFNLQISNFLNDSIRKWYINNLICLREKNNESVSKGLSSMIAENTLKFTDMTSLYLELYSKVNIYTWEDYYTFLKRSNECARFIFLDLMNAINNEDFAKRPEYERCIKQSFGDIYS